MRVRVKTCQRSEEICLLSQTPSQFVNNYGDAPTLKSRLFLCLSQRLCCKLSSEECASFPAPRINYFTTNPPDSRHLVGIMIANPIHPPNVHLKPNNCRTCRITRQVYLQNKHRANRRQIETQQCNKYTQMHVIKTTLNCLLWKRVVQSNLEVSNERERRFWGHYKIIFYRHS